MTSKMHTVSTAKAAKRMKSRGAPPKLAELRPNFSTMVQRTSDSSTGGGGGGGWKKTGDDMSDGRVRNTNGKVDFPYTIAHLKNDIIAMP